MNAERPDPLESFIRVATYGIYNSLQHLFPKTEEGEAAAWKAVKALISNAMEGFSEKPNNRAIHFPVTIDDSDKEMHLIVDLGGYVSPLVAPEEVEGLFQNLKVLYENRNWTMVKREDSAKKRVLEVI